MFLSKWGVKVQIIIEGNKFCTRYKFRIFIQTNRRLKMRTKILTAMGIILLVCLVAFLFFGLPIGFFFCSLVGLIYGIIQKDHLFVKWSSAVLVVDIVFWIFFYFGIQTM